VLKDAAEQSDGGPRSFPVACQPSFARTLAYDPLNEDYQKLFWRQATVSNSQPDALSRLHSAGWLIPEEGSVCKPVFIAHSVLSAIWLLRETLAEGALPAVAWARLVSAAQDLSSSPRNSLQEARPSAQQPCYSPPQSRKRAAASTSARPSKRLQRATKPSSLAMLHSKAMNDAEEPDQPEHTVSLSSLNILVTLSRVNSSVSPTSLRTPAVHRSARRNLPRSQVSLITIDVLRRSELRS
jgi:hypothetical protein